MLATGTGKSLIYRVVGQLLPGATVVVSPTVALQKDQLVALSTAGPPAAVLNSLLTRAQQRRVLERMAAGKLEFLLLSPEQLAREGRPLDMARRRQNPARRANGQPT